MARQEGAACRCRARLNLQLLPYQRHVLGDLQILLLGEISREISFKDTELISDLKEGLYTSDRLDA